MKTTLTIMVENTAGKRGTVGEHGFAAWIERGTDQTLFDTGAGNALLINTTSLQKDLRALNRVVLSHGHWDHTGGLVQLLEHRPQIEIIAHPGIFDERFSARQQGSQTRYHDASIPFTRETLEQAGARFHLTREYQAIAPGMYFSGEISRGPAWQPSDTGLVFKQDDADVLDPIMDDASLLLETDSGPVVVFGCAHAGADTILAHLAQKSGYQSFYAVIGGTHLMRATPARIDAVIDAFEHYQVQRVFTTHCTGFPAMARFAQHFQQRFVPAKVGDVFEF
ncbi:MBL fold metallo-hydrolase [candidate division KSB3 bacterium]|uniref:MBL fold metallo-hydrolase n=1 Tax=candidate division KSB3 bacterium TaxID=2044937 RepID=A0A9D5JX17_9BACT|nr:MBL fold metallo-hydrolase [candidate division KSB3 bacterium]MBD3325698.1 MBL fold metallo-hydrolase [candidate division KSB3 bacterium]